MVKDMWFTRRGFWLVALVISVLVFALAFAASVRAGVDYYFSFYPVVDDYLTGRTQLYDANNRGEFILGGNAGSV
ncbi:MAG: hypothetical protein ACFB51_14925 [Anaerolineae bacterium]